MRTTRLTCDVCAKDSEDHDFYRWARVDVDGCSGVLMLMPDEHHDIQSEIATTQVKAALQGMLNAINGERLKAGLPQVYLL